MIWKLSFSKPLYSGLLFILGGLLIASRGLCVEEKCVVGSADEDPISSPPMSPADWEASGPVEILALTNKCGGNVLFYLG